MPSEDGTWPDGYARMVLEETDSTMAEARRRAPAIAGPTWIMARRQTAGHGRRGRAWAMPEGNFAATLVLPRPVTALAAAQRSFVAALALYHALRSRVEPDAAGADRIRLKWPNDVLVDGGKIAGILLETHGSGGQPAHLAIGIGVNLAAAPPAEALETGAVVPAALSQFCEPPTPEQFLGDLAVSYAREERRFVELGFEETRRSWLSRAARLGEAIRVRTGTREETGIFRDVDKDGQLVLETADGRKVIPAAEVFF